MTSSPIDPHPRRHQPTVEGTALPVVVHVGFSGARELFAADLHPSLTPQEAEDRVFDCLVEQLSKLRRSLRLAESHFFCGVSQVAVGADLAFGRACAALRIPQRVMLPQPLDAYLDAANPEGLRDFDPDQRERAKEAAHSAHVIQRVVVSDAVGRDARFKDTAIEIVRISDVMICVVRADAPERQGGTVEVLRRARRRGLPVLLVTVAAGDDGLTCHPTLEGHERFQPPTLPAFSHAATRPRPLPEEPLPSCIEFAAALEEAAEPQAQRQSTAFRHAVRVIVSSHVAATFLATLGLVAHAERPSFLLPALLICELALLAWGYWRHRRLHAAETSEGWAVARLVGNIAASMRAIGEYPVYPAHLFSLSMPRRLAPLLATLNVLHLRSSRTAVDEVWTLFRDAYLAGRMRTQIDYYRNQGAAAQRGLSWTHLLFSVFSIGAISAALLKLSMVTPGLRVNGLMEWASWVEAHHDPLTSGVGLFAVVLPLLAVGALSRAAALDLQARATTFGEIQGFLNDRRADLEAADSAREYAALLMETEHRLLGEYAAWYYRRSFTSVQ